MALSLRVIRQLADGALLDRPVLATQCRRRALHSLSRQPPRRSTSAIAPTTTPASSAHQHNHAPLQCPGPASPHQPPLHRHSSSSSSSTRWKTRQHRDRFAKEAKVRGLKSRAAFKLLQLHERHRLFRAGGTVVDLGYAPGSWAQVAADRTRPGGRVVGIDVIPAQPPRGVSTIQGNFLSEAVQAEVRAYVRDPERGRPVQRQVLWDKDAAEEEEVVVVVDEEDEVVEGEEGEESLHQEGEGVAVGKGKEMTAEELEELERGYIDRERRASLIARPDEEGGAATGSGSEDTAAAAGAEMGKTAKKLGKRERDEALGRVVDVVLSDMMMNTSGMAFRDHAGSMDLCMAALTFAFDTLRTGGNFVCKFYQGAEDKALEKKLRRLFEKVHREKPDSSRSESKEAFFVALRRKADPSREDVFRED